MLISEYNNILRLIVFLFAMFSANGVAALELVIIEQADCAYCQRFNREIAPAYPKTVEGKRAPLRRVDLDDPWPDDLSNIRKERLTPTFILVDDNRELGRLRGYPGDEYFWFLLNQMFESINSDIE